MRRMMDTLRIGKTTDSEVCLIADVNEDMLL